METKTLEEALDSIRATMALSRARRTTQSPKDEKSKHKLRRLWLDKWLQLEITHPQLKTLEESIYDFCMEYGRRGDVGRRLLIYGGNGSGKSKTAKAVSRWAKRCAIYLAPVVRHGGPDIDAHSPRCTFRNFAALISELKASIGGGGYSELWEELVNVELLILDDIGADHDPSKFGVEKLYLLLEAREYRWTLLTTNISPDAWETRWERRVASRFLRNFTHVDVSQVPDYRALK